MRDVKFNPISGDEIMTRGNRVLIERVAGCGDVGYRYLKSDESCSRVFTASIDGYRMWPISEVLRRGDDGIAGGVQ